MCCTARAAPNHDIIYIIIISIAHMMPLSHTCCFSYVLMEMEPLVGRQGTLDEQDGDDEESGR